MNNKPIYFKLMFQKIDPRLSIKPDVEVQARHDDTFVRLTPKITESQFDGYIDHLIKELEYIRREGKRKFAAIAKELQDRKNS